jgi:hypothetical protein
LLFFCLRLAEIHTFNNFSAKHFSRITIFPPDLAESANKKSPGEGARHHAQK